MKIKLEIVEEKLRAEIVDGKKVISFSEIDLADLWEVMLDMPMPVDFSMRTERNH